MQKKTYLSSTIFSALFILLGIFFITIITPNLLQIPKDFSYQADVVSLDSFYDAVHDSYADPLESKSRFYYETLSQENEVLNINHIFDVRQLNGSPIFTVERNYFVNQNTQKHVSGISGTNRNGYLFGPRGNAQSFEYWHVNYDAPITMEYEKTIQENGLDLRQYKGVISADQTMNLTNLPGVPEERGIITEGTITTWIEPTTGYFVNYEDSATAWYYNQENKQKINPWNSFSNTYSQLSHSFHLSQAKKIKNTLFLFKFFLPIVCFLIGFLVLAFVLRTKKRGGKQGVIFGFEDGREIVNVLLLPMVTFVILSSVVVWLFFEIKLNIKDDNYEVFDQETRLIENAITNRVNLYTSALQSGVGLFNASSDVTRSEWKIFSEGLNLHENFPGIQGYGYSLRIPRSQKENHINEIKSQGYSDYTIKPEGERNEYTSVVFIEPFDDRNIQAFGLDMTFEENRRTAMHSARDSGEAHMSGRVTLVQEIDGDVQAGFLIYVPQYQEFIDLNTVNQRRTFLQGYVYSPFRMRDFMTGILGNRDLILDFQVYDGGPENIGHKEYLMYSSVRSGEEDVPKEFSYLTRESTITIANKEWSIVFHPRPEFGLGLARQSSAIIVLVSGLLLSMFISIILYLVSVSRAHAITIARDMTKHLQEETQAKVDIANNLKETNKKLLKQSKTLEQKIKEIEKINKHLVGRELKMVELKDQLRALKK